MPRTTKVLKAKKRQGVCEKCGTLIDVGDPYVWWKFNFGARHIRCAKPECHPKASDLTNSEWAKFVADVQEEDFKAESVEDAQSKCDDLIDRLESFRDEQQEKLDNMPEGLQQGDTGQLIQERIEQLESAISELQSLDFSDPEDDDPADKDRTDEQKEEARQERLDQLLDQLAEDMAGAVSGLS